MKLVLLVHTDNTRSYDSRTVRDRSIHHNNLPSGDACHRRQILRCALQQPENQFHPEYQTRGSARVRRSGSYTTHYVYSALLTVAHRRLKHNNPAILFGLQVGRFAMFDMLLPEHCCTFTHPFVPCNIVDNDANVTDTLCLRMDVDYASSGGQ